MVDLDTLELIQQLRSVAGSSVRAASLQERDAIMRACADRLEEQHRRLASKDAELNAAEDAHAAEKRELLARVDHLEVVVCDLYDIFRVLRSTASLTRDAIDDGTPLPCLYLTPRKAVSDGD